MRLKVLFDQDSDYQKPYSKNSAVPLPGCVLAMVAIRNHLLSSARLRGQKSVGVVKGATE